MASAQRAVIGVNHITLSVRDLGRSWTFYTELLGLTPAARWYKGAYLRAGDLWITLTLDEAVRLAPLPEYTHLAFTVAEPDFAALERRIRDSGATIWQQNHSEGASLYFLDPDHHKLEIHSSSLHARLIALKEQAPRDLVLFG